MSEENTRENQRELENLDIEHPKDHAAGPPRSQFR